MRESVLHPEFADLQGKVHYVVERIRGKQWSSSCPFCGGEPHSSGEWPNRFVMYPASSSKHGITIGWCRCCNGKWFPTHEYKLDPEKLELWRQDRIRRLEQDLAETQKALSFLRNEHRWSTYYTNLQENPLGQSAWIGAGILEEFWWNEWQLGYDPEHVFWYDRGVWQKHVTPTMTIPVRNLQGEIINIKHRAMNPYMDDNANRYRMEYKTGLEPCFIGNLSQLECDTTWLVEGEKKAACTFIGVDRPDHQVIGLPKSPSEELVRSIPSKTIIYVPDPDVEPNMKRRILSACKGKEFRVISLPDKIDDWAIRVSATKQHFTSLLSSSRRIV
jgi:hypothetical protein